MSHHTGTESVAHAARQTRVLVGDAICMKRLYLVMTFWLILCIVQIEAGHTNFARSHHLARPGPTQSGGSAKQFDVRSFGARGDGSSDDTRAFLTAWGQACGSGGVATILVPAGYSFVLASNTEFSGASCSAQLIFQVNGNILGPGDKSKWTQTGGGSPHWIQFTDCKGFKIEGRGTFDARGQSFWGNAGRSRPTAIRFLRATNVAVLGITIKNSPQVHLKFNWCNGGLIQGVTIIAPGNSPNTDGIHLQTEVYNFQILDCIIASGDDCISIQTGTHNVVIRGIVCGPGHGISIGALGNQGTIACVSFIDISNVIFKNTLAACRIKTWQGGRGLASHISYHDITVENVEFPILIDQFYGGSSSSGGAFVALDGIRFSSIRGTASANSPFAVQMVCASGGCNNVQLSDIDITRINNAPSHSYCERSYGSVAGLMNPPACVKGGQVSFLGAGHGMC